MSDTTYDFTELSKVDLVSRDKDVDFSYENVHVFAEHLTTKLIYIVKTDFPEQYVSQIKSGEACKNLHAFSDATVSYVSELQTDRELYNMLKNTEFSSELTFEEFLTNKSNWILQYVNNA